jgi:hypothetical protein
LTNARILIAGLLLALTCALPPLSAAPHWICVSNSHFEMYTTNSEKQAERALQTFEQVRYFFQRNSRTQKAPQERVRIIAFSGENEFKPYRLNSGNFAFYLQSRERDYIVMQDIEPDHLQAAAHEYTHLIIRHDKLDLPLWLDEGLADLYSSLEPRGKQALVGRPLPQHIMTLRTLPWIDLNTLFSVDRESPYYNQSDKMQVFYAESWELTHMINLSPAYNSRFADFLTTVNGGTGSAEAFAKVYGKSLAQVAKDAQDYMNRATVPAAIFDVTLKKSDIDVDVAPLSEFQIELALCDLLATRPQTAEEARRRLLMLEQQNPESAEVEESLGYLAWQENDAADARKHFQLAVNKGSRDGRLFYDYSNLQHAATGSSAVVIDLMKKAVDLNPDETSWRILLAQLEVEGRLYGQALGVLAPIRALDASEAFDFYTVSAYCHANLRDFPGASAFIQKAAPYAKTPQQQHQVQEFKAYLSAAGKPDALTGEDLLQGSAGASEPGPASEIRRSVPGRLAENTSLPRVHGVTKAFQCGQHSFRLHLQVGSREMVFAIADPKDIVVRNVVELQWTCGPLKPQEVTVVYKPAPTADVDGAVAELVF